MNEGNTAQRAYWNTVAGPRWVALGEAMDARLREVNTVLLGEARPAPGERVLEIGCGTAATTVPLAEAVGAGGRVLGADIAEPMLAVARARIAKAGLGQVSLVLADAQVHEFPPSEFDLIVSRFGVMFFVDPVAAFRNLRRALRAGGRLCFVCWAPVAENPHWLVPLELAVRRLGPPAPTSPRAPGPLAFSDREYVREILEGAGFAAVRIERRACHILGASAEAEAEHAVMMGPSGRLLEEKQADEATREAFRREVIAAFAAHAGADGVALAATVFVVTAAAGHS